MCKCRVDFIGAWGEVDVICKEMEPHLKMLKKALNIEWHFKVFTLGLHTVVLWDKCVDISKHFAIIAPFFAFLPDVIVSFNKTFSYWKNY